MTYKMTEQECEEKTGHCWHTPIIHICQHCGKVQDGPPMHGIDRPGPGPGSDPRLSNPIRAGAPLVCPICGRFYLIAFLHRLTRGHWPR